MKEFLFDTSALLYAVAAKKYEQLGTNCYILDLTCYEYGNAILNILTKRGHLQSRQEEEARPLVQAFEKIAELVPAIKLESTMMKPVLELARKENLTFYDASYLYCCLHSGYQLVTEDRRLKQAARNNSIRATDTEGWAGSSSGQG